MVFIFISIETSDILCHHPEILLLFQGIIILAGFIHFMVSLFSKQQCFRS